MTTALVGMRNYMSQIEALYLGQSQSRGITKESRGDEQTASALRPVVESEPCSVKQQRTPEDHR